MQLFVHTLSGNTVTLNVNADDTIKHVKQDIEAQTGVCYKKLMMYLDNTLLKQYVAADRISHFGMFQATLADYGIGDGAELTIVAMPGHDPTTGDNEFTCDQCGVGVRAARAISTVRDINAISRGSLKLCMECMKCWDDSITALKNAHSGH